MGPVEAKRAFEPWQGLFGSACPHQNIPSLPIAFRIAGVDLERTVDLPKCEIVSSSIHVDVGKQSVGARRDGIERQRLLCKRFGALDLVLAEFRPSRYHSLVMCPSEPCIGSGIVRIEVDRALENMLRLVILVACRVRQ